MKRKVMAILMAAALCVGLLPSTTLAEVGEYAADDAEDSAEETEVQAANIELAEDGTATVVLGDVEGEEEQEEEAAETEEPLEAEPDGEAEEAAEAEEEAGPEEVVYTGQDGSVSVKVTAPYGALPEDAELKVERFDKDSKEYKDAAEAIGLDEDDPNMAALDISFVADGEEVEPGEAVKVSIDASKILPENADASTLEVQHLKEGRGGQVKAEVVANESKETEGTIDKEEAIAEFEVDSFSSFTITWNPTSGDSTTVTVYVYDMNGLGIYDAESSYTLTSDTISISDLVAEHATEGISGDYSFVYATAQYLTTSNQGGSVTTIGSESDPVTQISWNGTNYVVTTSSGSSTTVTKTDTVAAEFYINLYYSTPTVTIAPTAIESGTGNVTLTATTEYFPEGEEITYTWEIAEGSEYASITDNGDTATVTWNTGDAPGSDVTVRVIATTSSGESATATYDLEYGMQQVTYTVYLPDETTVVEGAHVSIMDEDGKVVSYGTTDANGQVTLWVTAGTTYTMEASYTASSGSGIAMTYTHYTYENTNYLYSEGDETNIILEVSDANFYEHVDVKLSIADLDDEGYSDILANVDYVNIYDEDGQLVYKSTQMVHNSGTNDYNVLFGDADGNSRGDNDHSIAFYDTYTIEIAYEVTYTYTDSEGNTASYTESYVATIDKNSTYIDGEYYSYSGTNAYQLYNELNGTSISEDDWETALQNGTMEQLLGGGYNEHGIDISGQTYFFVAAALCDTRDTANQAGLDLALGVNSLRRYSSTAWNFEIQKTLKNAAMTADQFSFDLYAANVEEDNTWYIYASGDADDGLQQEYTNSEASKDGTESVTYKSGTYVFNFDSSMVGEPQTYYFVLLEKQGEDSSITYDDTVYGIAVTVTLNSATDMTDVTITESYCILEQTSTSDGYIYYTVINDNPSLSNDEGVTIYPFENTYSEYTDITVEKVWADNDNGYETRPESITVTVTGGDDNEYTLTLSDSNSWKDTVSDLPVYADDGSEIKYTVTEGTVNGYTGTVVDNGDGTFTITNTLDTTELSGSKTWDDSDNKYGTRPESITINILNGEETVTSVTVTENDNWQWNVTGLPKYDSNGSEITYTISEVAVTGYSTELSNYDVINTLETVDLSGSKVWVGNGGEDEEGSITQPDSITVFLMYEDGTYVRDASGNQITTTATADDWTWSFTGLPKYDSDGKEITYTVLEEEVTGYIPTYDTDDGKVTITNAIPEVHKYEADLNYNEEVDDNEQETESDNNDTLEYKLEADHIGGAHDLVLHDFLDNQLDIETLEIQSVTLYTAEGEGIELSEGTDYTVTEGECTAECGLDGCSFEIHIEDTDVEDLTSDAYIIVIFDIELKEGVEDFDDTYVDEVDNFVGLSFTVFNVAAWATPDETETYSYGFDLYKYDGDTDEPLAGVEFVMSNSDGKYAQFDVTDETYLLTGWADSKDDATTIVSGSDGQAVVEGLHDGTFNIEETKALDGYQEIKGNITVTITVGDDPSNPTISATGATYEDGEVKIENTPGEDLITIVGSKTWDDSDDADGVRPDSITIHLLADGDEVDSATVTSDDNWAWSFKDLAKYQDDGTTEITYTITEDAVDDYDTTISGYNVTNIHEPETRDISGSKTWEDDNDKADARPSSITVNLFQNGELYDSKTVTEDDDWAWSWTGLPKNASGEAIAYTITEDAVDYYDTTYYSGSFDITNTFVGEEGAEPGSGQGGDNPKTGDTNSLGTWLALLIAAMACLLVGFRMRKSS